MFSLPLIPFKLCPQHYLARALTHLLLHRWGAYVPSLAAQDSSYCHFLTPTWIGWEEIPISGFLSTYRPLAGKFTPLPNLEVVTRCQFTSLGSLVSRNQVTTHTLRTLFPSVTTHRRCLRKPFFPQNSKEQERELPPEEQLNRNRLHLNSLLCHS